MGFANRLRRFTYVLAIGVGASLQAALAELLNNARAVKTFKEFQARRMELHQTLQQLTTLSANETLLRIHGSSLSESLEPIRTLLANMDKPAQAAGSQKAK